MTACGASPAASTPKPASPSTDDWKPPWPPSTPTLCPTAAPTTPWNATGSSAPTPSWPSPTVESAPGGDPKWSWWSTPPPPMHRHPHHRLGTPRRTPHRGPAPPLPWPTSTPSSCTEGRPPRPRTARPGTLHPPRQPGPTPHPASPLPHLRHPRLPTRYAVQTPPRPLVGTRRPHRPPQPPPALPTHHHAVHHRHWQLPSPPTANSPSPTPTAPPTTPDHPDAGYVTIAFRCRAPPSPTPTHPSRRCGRESTRASSRPFRNASRCSVGRDGVNPLVS